MDKAARLTVRDGRDPKVSLVSGPLTKGAGFFYAPAPIHLTTDHTEDTDSKEHEFVFVLSVFGPCEWWLIAFLLPLDYDAPLTCPFETHRMRLSLLGVLLAASPLFAQGFTPEDALKRMQLPSGFSAKAVATEPMIRQPLSISFDERGRMWVLQYLQYPNPAGLKPLKQDQYLRKQNRQYYHRFYHFYHLCLQQQLLYQFHLQELLNVF